MQLSSDYAAQILQQPHLAARNIDPTQLLKNQVREQKACVIVEQLAVGAAVGSQKGRDSYRCSERESYQLPSCLIQLFICWWTLVSLGHGVEKMLGHCGSDSCECFGGEEGAQLCSCEIVRSEGVSVGLKLCKVEL